MEEEERLKDNKNVDILPEFLEAEGIFKLEPQHLRRLLLFVSFHFVETVEDESAWTLGLVFVVVYERFLCARTFLYDFCQLEVVECLFAKTVLDENVVDGEIGIYAENIDFILI